MRARQRVYSTQIAKKLFAGRICWLLLLSSQDREKERESEQVRLRLAAAGRAALWVCLFRLLPPAAAAATAADSIDYTREWKKLTLLMSSLAPTCCTEAGGSRSRSSHGSKALGISEGCLKVGGAHSHTQSRSAWDVLRKTHNFQCELSLGAHVVWADVGADAMQQLLQQSLSLFAHVSIHNLFNKISIHLYVYVFYAHISQQVCQAKLNSFSLHMCASSKIHFLLFFGCTRDNLLFLLVNFWIYFTNFK